MRLIWSYLGRRAWRTISSRLHILESLVNIYIDLHGRTGYKLQFYRTVYLEGEPTIRSVCTTISTVFSPRRLRSKTAMAFITFSMIFLLAMPSLLSAMSGYDTNTAAFIQDPSSATSGHEIWVEFRTYSVVEFIVHDGWRVGIERDHLVDAPLSGR